MTMIIRIVQAISSKKAKGTELNHIATEGQKGTGSRNKATTIQLTRPIRLTIHTNWLTPITAFMYTNAIHIIIMVFYASTSGSNEKSAKWGPCAVLSSSAELSTTMIM